MAEDKRTDKQMIQHRNDTIDALKKELTHWKANHSDMVNRNALLQQRPDLPVDRIPVYQEMVKLQKENAVLRDMLKDCRCSKT